MLYVTTYYDNVKPCRRVGRLPTAGRGGYHPQVASSDWPILVDGHGRMVGETRPRDRSARSVLLRKTPRQKAGLKGYERSSHAGKITPDSESPITLTSSPNEVVFRETAKSPGRPYCNGPPGPISSPHGETHFRKRSNLSGHGASRAAAYAALLCLRSYRQQNQTLLSQSPPPHFFHHGATRWCR